jgi:hypothetical protein
MLINSFSKLINSTGLILTIVVELSNSKSVKTTLFLFLISTTALIAFINIQQASGVEYATMRIVNPLTGDGKFIFNATEGINYTGTTFTVEFYIRDVSDMIAWQFAISWNNSIFQYNASKNPYDWMFQGHVFQQAENEGAYVVKLVQLQHVINQTGRFQDPTAPGTAYLLAGATAYDLFTGGFYPVTVKGEALLCRINFTIVAPQSRETLESYINIEKRLDPINPSLDSFIMNSDMQQIEILTEPGIVRIIAGELTIIRDIAITDVTFDKTKFFVGSNVTITIRFKNEGNDQEKFNFTIECEKEDGSLKQTLLRHDMMLNPSQEDYYPYFWVIQPNFPTGKYILKVSVEPLEGEEDLSDNERQLTINVEKELLGFEYLLWLISLWLSTPLGTLLIIYLASVIGFFSILKVIKRIKR